MTTAAVRLLDYHAAREAEEIALEAAAGTRRPGHDRDASRFYAQTGDGQGQAGRQPLTLRRWLEQTARQDPSPDAVVDLERREVARLQDAHAAAEEAREAYERLTAERGAIMAELVAAGRSYADVGSMVGVTRARAHQLVTAHRQRAVSEPQGDPW